MTGKASDGPSTLTGPVRRIAHYEILGELGRGGMGVVYRARDLNLGREVALKCPSPTLGADPKSRRRFLREGKAASSLSHPHIVPVFEVFEVDGLPWLAMEIVEGESLRAALAGGHPLPVDDVIRHAEGLAGALEAAHARHVLHRDVNPRNVLVARDGRARLADFGLAKAFVPPEERSSASTQSSEGTESGAVVGTPGYMSPEQALGRPVDPRSDIFSLGTVLYEMCTGRPAFVASERGDVLDAILHVEPAPIARMNYEVPDELTRIVRKCLAKQPDERYQGCSDLLADLRALRRLRESGQSLPRPVRPVRRVAVRLMLFVAALALGVAAAALYFRPWSRGALLPIGTPRQVTSARGWEAEPALAFDGGMVAYDSDESGNSDVWVSDVHGGTPLRLTDDPGYDGSPAWFPDGSAIAFVSDRGGPTSIWKVPRLGGAATLVVPDARDPALSFDGRRIAFVRAAPSGDMRVAIAPIDDPGRAAFLTGDRDGVWDHRSPAWSPDGRTLCYAASRALWVVPADGSAPARRLTRDAETDMDPAWSADGRFIYFSSYRGGTLAIWRIPAEGGRPKRITLGTGPESQPGIARDGTRLVYSTYLKDPDLILRDLASRTESRIHSVLVDAIPSFAPDGSALVFVSNRWGGRYDLWLQKLANGKPSGTPQRLTDQPGSAQHPAWSPDGAWIAYFRVVQGQRDVWIVPAAGGQPVQFTDDPAVDIHPAWSPDGRQIVFVSEREGGSHLWTAPVAGGRPAGAARRLTSGETTDMAPAWSPDGTQVAYIGQSDKGVEVWIVRADGGGAPRRITTGAGARRVRWDRTGRRLLVSGAFGEDDITLRSMTPDGTAIAPFDPPVRFGIGSSQWDFDLSADDRLLAYSQEEVRGDIWVLEARPGSF